MRRRSPPGRTGTGEIDDPRRRRFDDLVEANYAPLLGYALRRTEQPADAADVVCDVFLVAWRRIDDMPPDREATLWLYGVARRTLANHRRVGERRDALSEKLRLAYFDNVEHVVATDSGGYRTFETWRDDLTGNFRMVTFGDKGSAEEGQIIWDYDSDGEGSARTVKRRIPTQVRRFQPSQIPPPRSSPQARWSRTVERRLTGGKRFDSGRATVSLQPSHGWTQRRSGRSERPPVTASR